MHWDQTNVASDLCSEVSIAYDGMDKSPTIASPYPVCLWNCMLVRMWHVCSWPCALSVFALRVLAWSSTGELKLKPRRAQQN